MLVPLPFRYSKAISGYASTLELLLGMTRSKAELPYIYGIFRRTFAQNLRAVLRTCTYATLSAPARFRHEYSSIFVAYA